MGKTRKEQSRKELKEVEEVEEVRKRNNLGKRVRSQNMKRGRSKRTRGDNGERMKK